MTLLMRASDLMGLPVVSIDTGEDVAEIRDVVYDASTHRVLGFTLNKRGFLGGRLKSNLAISSIHAVGPQAVMVPSESDVLEERPDDEAVSAPSTAVIGHRVLNAAGSELGQVVGVIVEAGSSAAAVGYEVEPPDGSGRLFVPISMQMALSSDNVLLPEGAEAFVRHDLGAFGAAVSEYRSSETQAQPSQSQPPSASGAPAAPPPQPNQPPAGSASDPSAPSTGDPS